MEKLVVLLAEIRGAGFRLTDPVNPSPAKALLDALPTGTELKLEREPTNAHDKNAIKVWLTKEVMKKAIPAYSRPEGAAGSDFEIRLNGYGWSLEMLEDGQEFMLGYVGKEWAERLAPLLDGASDQDARKLVAESAPTTSAKNRPTAGVKISWEEG